MMSLWYLNRVGHIYFQNLVNGMHDAKLFMHSSVHRLFIFTPTWLTLYSLEHFLSSTSFKRGVIKFAIFSEDLIIPKNVDIQLS